MGITALASNQVWFKLISSSCCFLLCLAFPHLLNIQHLLLPRDIALILARLTWVGMALTRTPTATWWKRSCSRTSASPTQRRLVGHKIRKNVLQNFTRTALESSRRVSSVFVSMLTNLFVI